MANDSGTLAEEGNDIMRGRLMQGMVKPGEPGMGTAALDGNAPPPCRVYIIDDDSDVRKSLHFLLATSSITAWPFAAAADFIDQLPDLAPAPILLDVRMADIDGIELLAILKERDVSWPVIIMTAHGDIGVAVRAMKLGAIEFIEKPFGLDLLMNALDQAFGILEQTVRSQRTRDHARRLFGELTNREKEIVTVLMEGVPNKLVAHRLGLSVRTVEMHRSNALAKLEVKSIAEVMALAAMADSAQAIPLVQSEID